MIFYKYNLTLRLNQDRTVKFITVQAFLPVQIADITSQKINV